MAWPGHDHVALGATPVAPVAGWGPPMEPGTMGPGTLKGPPGPAASVLSQAPLGHGLQARLGHVTKLMNYLLDRLGN